MDSKFLNFLVNKIRTLAEEGSKGCSDDFAVHRFDEIIEFAEIIIAESNSKVYRG